MEDKELLFTIRLLEEIFHHKIEILVEEKVGKELRKMRKKNIKKMKKKKAINKED